VLTLPYSITFYIRIGKNEGAIANDTAATLSITERMIRWVPDDSYAQAMGNKQEYAG
jgi:hypothetical protein